MTPEELATNFEFIRCMQRQIQLAVYRTRMAAAYHIGKARDMLADSNRARALTELEDVAQLCKQLPALIDRIGQLNDLADAAWSELVRNGGDHADYATELAEAYDELHLHSRVYERLVRQSEKPMLLAAQGARDLPGDAPSRRSIERSLRMAIEDYLALESEIANNLRQIDTARNIVVEAHLEAIDEYVRGKGRNDQISLAAGRHAVRLATTRFDDRQGYGFMSYAHAWIDRELDRVGEADEA